MTTKEFLISSLECILEDEYPEVSHEQLKAFIKVIQESPTLDKFDDFVKSKGYDDINDYNNTWCEGHFDDGFYDDDIYQSIEAFRNHIEGYATPEVMNATIPHKTKL